MDSNSSGLNPTQTQKTYKMWGSLINQGKKPIGGKKKGQKTSFSKS